MDKNIENNAFRLKRIQKNIEAATEKKELEQIQIELVELEKEIAMLGNIPLQKFYLEKAKFLKTHNEIYRLRKEVQSLLKEASARHNELDDKKQQITDKGQDKEQFLDNLDAIDEKRKEFAKRIEEAIRESTEIRKQVERDIKVTETVEVIKKRESVLLDTLLLIYLAKSDMDKMIKVPLTLAIVSDITRKLSIKDEEIIHYDYHYEDLTQLIDGSLDSVSDIEKAIRGSFEDVKDMQKNYEKKFGDFSGLKEFQDISVMLDTIYKTLDQEIDKVQEIEKDLDKSLDENKEKVLKLDLM